MPIATNFDTPDRQAVDTGAIIAQVPITIEPTDTYRTLPVKQYLAALDAMSNAVQAAPDGTLSTYERSDLESHQWYSPTPAEYCASSTACAADSCLERTLW